MAFADYVTLSAREPLVIIQIEHVAALDDLEAILAVNGVDSICIGPCDLSASMSRLGQPDADEVERVIDTICAAARARGMMIGTAAGGDPETIARWRRRGANWLAVTSDCGCIYGRSRDILSRIRA
jgi:2-keto-3-deoxy-L-rhamnonate aldolase RhmA